MKGIFLVMVIFLALSQSDAQVIVNHKAVDQYSLIPQEFIDLIKQQRLVVPGESHSEGYRAGLNLLEALDSRFVVNVTSSGSPEAPGSSYLRMDNLTWGNIDISNTWWDWYGEEDWWTSSAAISRTIAGIDYANANNAYINAMGLGWCWDHTYGSVSASVDPVYGVHWYGWSQGSPEGNLPWGLNADDNSVSGNSVNMQTYLDATQAYIDHCATQGYTTKIFFTTAPMDDDEGRIGAEALYQGHLKNEYIREYVNAGSDIYLFDYADILAYDDAGQLTTATWNGNTFPFIAPANDTEDVGHISNAGALRLGKAMWWMLARMAGWDGNPTAIEPNDNGVESAKVFVQDREIVIEMDESAGYTSVTLINLEGKCVDEVVVRGGSCHIRTDRHSRGVYFVKLTKSDHDSETRKVIL